MKNICVFCGGDVKPGITRVIEEVDDDVIIIERVPAGVCNRCGEKEFTPDVVRELERIRRDRAQIANRREVPVVEFDAVAA